MCSLAGIILKPVFAKAMNILFPISFIVLSTQTVNAVHAPTWNFCGCYWEAWRAWSQCSSSCGGGTQIRERWVWFRDVPECFNFNMCATNDEGSDSRSCNTNCFNGGTFKISYSIGYCSCPKGKTGSCCEQTVECGRPSSISNGEYTGSDFTYNHNVEYRCNIDYNMTDPTQATRTCTENGYWNGRTPVCIYANSCKSQPCKNGAVCVNLLGDYQCNCLPGWSGKSCDVDVQPPVVSNCPSDRLIHTANLTSVQSWTEPNFADPHNTTLHITKNYMTTSYEFPWGEFTVQYEAVKPSNGLKAECVFNVSVKPFSCKPLAVPLNGIIACNGWRREYTRVCKLFCKTNFTLPSGIKEDNIFVCGATGHWLPANPVEKCFSGFLFPQINNGVDNEQFSSCAAEDEKSRISNNYIRTLTRSSVNALCLNYASDCRETNVDVFC